MTERQQLINLITKLNELNQDVKVVEYYTSNDVDIYIDGVGVTISFDNNGYIKSVD